jgi:hypothetical protein
MTFRLFFYILLTATFVAGASSGCAALKSANDARVWLCDNIGAEHKAEIEEQAKKTGVSADEIWKIWKASCLIRMHQAETGAVGAIGETKP